MLSTYSQFVDEGPLTKAQDLFIPKGQSLKQIARLLKNKGVISSPSVFELGVRASGNTLKIKAGEYNIPPRASAKLVMNILIGGQTVVRRFIAPEGMTSAQIIALMDLYKGLTGTVSDIPKNGTLLPDTYHYSYGDTKASLIKRMQNAMTRTLDELWEGRDKNVPFKSASEAVIMASIVEKETSLNSERARIASVFFNRLKKNIRLQSDPTVIYAVTEGRLDLKRRLTYKDLKIQHPYNTYVVYGLPEGPISNPGKESLKAVLNPINSPYVYFVADGTGGHVFAETYKEHQKNVAHWRKIRKDKAALAIARKTGKASSLPMPQAVPDDIRSASPIKKDQNPQK